MILVTLGTQKQKFYRLLDAIEKLNTDEEIIVQAGGSADYKSDKMKIFDFGVDRTGMPCYNNFRRLTRAVNRGA